MSYLKKLTVLASIFFVCVTTETIAEPHKGSIQIGRFAYNSSIDYKGNLEGLSAELEGVDTLIRGEYFITEHISISAMSASGDADVTFKADAGIFGVSSIVGNKLEVDGSETSVEIMLHLSPRPDLVMGTGQGFAFGVEQLEVEVTLLDETTKEDYTDLIIQYTYGVGDGLSIIGALDLDSKDMFDDYAISVGVIKSLPENFFVRGDYSIGGSDDEDSTADSVGLYLSIGAYF